MRARSLGRGLLLIALLPSLAANVLLLTRHPAAQASPEAQFFSMADGRVIVVLSDALLESMLGHGWRSKLLFFDVRGWEDLKGGRGTMHEPRFFDPLLASGAPVLVLRAHDNIAVVVLSLKDKESYLLTLDLSKHSIAVGTPVVSRGEYVLQANGSLEYRPPGVTGP